MKNKKILIYIIILVVLLIILCYEINDIKKQYDINQESANIIIKGENEKNELESRYASLARKYKNDTNTLKMENPYIPDGFKYIEGAWDTGYVIEDNNGNQFVWVPCSGNENNINFVKKYEFLKEDGQSHIEVTFEKNAQEFLESIYENGGYYIARFETGIENNKPVIKKDVNIYSEVNFKEAKKMAKEMYTNIKSDLINMYAYDIALNWCMNTKKENPEEIGKRVREKIDEKFVTGVHEINHIYDLLDCVWEWSTESYYEFNVARGVEMVDEPEVTRFPLKEEFVSENLTYRVIIYK